jgi:hypothetical protein
MLTKVTRISRKIACSKPNIRNCPRPLSGCDSFFENEITSNRERQLCLPKLSSRDEHPRERAFIFFGQQLERALYCRFLASDYSCLRARNREKLILSEVSALLTRSRAK